MYSIDFEDGWYNVYRYDVFVDGFESYGDALSYAYFLEASDEEWIKCTG